MLMLQQGTGSIAYGVLQMAYTEGELLETEGASPRKDTEEHHLPLLWHSRCMSGISDIQYFVLVTAAKELAMKRFSLSPKQEVML